MTTTGTGQGHVASSIYVPDLSLVESLASVTSWSTLFHTPLMLHGKPSLSSILSALGWAWAWMLPCTAWVGLGWNVGKSMWVYGYCHPRQEREHFAFSISGPTIHIHQTASDKHCVHAPWSVSRVSRAVYIVHGALLLLVLGMGGVPSYIRAETYLLMVSTGSSVCACVRGEAAHPHP